MLCPFLKGLFEKLRAGPPGVHPLTPAAGFTYRRNAAVALNALRVREALTLCSERGNQPRRKCFAIPGNELTIGKSECSWAMASICFSYFWIVFRRTCSWHTSSCTKSAALATTARSFVARMASRTCWMNSSKSVGQERASLIKTLSTSAGMPSVQTTDRANAQGTATSAPNPKKRTI